MRYAVSFLRCSKISIHWYSDLEPDWAPELKPRDGGSWQKSFKCRAVLNFNLAIRESTFYHMDPTDSRSFFSYTLDPHNCMRREHFKLGEILPHIRVRVQPIPISICWACCIHCCIALHNQHFLGSKLGICQVYFWFIFALCFLKVDLVFWYVLLFHPNKTLKQ